MSNSTDRLTCHRGVCRSPHERGSVLVELAVVLPLLTVLLVGTLDFARIMYTAMALTNAARAGVQYGAQSLAKSGDTAGMQAAAQNAASLDIGSIPTPTVSRTCGCNDATPTVGACTTSCAGTLRVFVSVTTSKTFTTLVRLPGFPSSVTLSRTAELRAQ